MPSQTFDSSQFSGRPFLLRLNVSTNDQPSNNRSIVNWNLQIVPIQGIWTSWNQNTSGPFWAVGIDGPPSGPGNSDRFTYNFRPPNVSNPGVGPGTTLTIANGSKTVNHNSNGSKTISVQFLADGQNPIGFAIRSGSMALTTYPRAPNPPATVTANAPIARTIAVSWDAASGGAGVTDYTVQRSENSGTYGNSFNTSARNFTDANLNPRSTYRYRVRANGPGGSSGFRQSQSRTIAPAASPPVTTAERTLRTVEVTMTEPSVIDNTTNIVSYTTERRQNGGNWGDQKTTTDLNNRSITYTNLPSETNQQFRGRANTNRGSSNFSESQTLFIPGLPDAPSQVIEYREGASVRVVIAAPVSDGGAPVLTYTIEKRISDNFGSTWSAWGEPVTITFAQPFYLYENLELQKTYQFRALATNEEGNSEQFTESNTVYLPAIMRIYDDGQFRLPADYKRYSEDVGDWVGLSISRRYFNGQWVELE